MPLDPLAHAALTKEHVKVGRPKSGWVFPSTATPDGAACKDDAKDWFRRAERLAGEAHVKGRGWHSLRRAWANARKHFPVADLKAAGGWSDDRSLLNCYTAADPATVFRVMNEPVYRRDSVRTIYEPIQADVHEKAPVSVKAVEIGRAHV